MAMATGDGIKTMHEKRHSLWATTPFATDSLAHIAHVLPMPSSMDRSGTEQDAICLAAPLYRQFHSCTC